MPNIDYELLPQKVEGVEYLAELALDLRNTWDHATDEIWEQLDPELWNLTRNPWLVLQTVSRTKLKKLAADDHFRAEVAKLVGEPRKAPGRAVVVRAEPSELTAYLRGLLQHGVRSERGAADLLRRSGQRGGRPTQGRQRPGRAGSRRRAALSAGLFPPIYRRRRQSDRALSLTTIPASCRLLRCATPDGEWFRLPVIFPAVRLWLRAWQVRVGRVDALSARQQRPRQFAGLPRHDQRALRRRAGTAAAARN